MPYIDEHYGFCKPQEKGIEVGDVIAVKPFLATVNGRSVVFPPLTIASIGCERKAQFTLWVDGVRVKGTENIEVRLGDIEVSGWLEVKSKEFLPAFTARKLLGEARLKVDGKGEGTEVVTLGGLPLLSVKDGKVVVHTRERLDVLIPLAYSLFYFLSSGYSEDI
ncbi:MAG: hypothetical protein ASUL_06158 [Candidatus Aramenus sulfurataquae]|jgi:hypothetical protein|uniref:Uncharacterized protein n=2 Tax=Candidatus Aramenus sulfurataquae TaxID=1326980 RepID=W7KUZ5_9CREN|nr:MAG: hypothetical protein ASUL_06158 [Candidatus Aramenus sulfurataquae]MCL7344091.1 hypothetical protein [Candidatus Aramenus sulfurataquae]